MKPMSWGESTLLRHACIVVGCKWRRDIRFHFFIVDIPTRLRSLITMHSLISKWKYSTLLHFLLNLQDVIFLAYSLGSKYVGQVSMKAQSSRPKVLKKVKSGQMDQSDLFNFFKRRLSRSTGFRWNRIYSYLLAALRNPIDFGGSCQYSYIV